MKLFYFLLSVIVYCYSVIFCFVLFVCFLFKDIGIFFCLAEKSLQKENLSRYDSSWKLTDNVKYYNKAVVSCYFNVKFIYYIFSCFICTQFLWISLFFLREMIIAHWRTRAFLWRLFYQAFTFVPSGKSMNIAQKGTQTNATLGLLTCQISCHQHWWWKELHFDPECNVTI